MPTCNCEVIGSGLHHSPHLMPAKSGRKLAVWGNPSQSSKYADYQLVMTLVRIHCWKRYGPGAASQRGTGPGGPGGNISGRTCYDSAENIGGAYPHGAPQRRGCSRERNSVASNPGRGVVLKPDLHPVAAPDMRQGCPDPAGPSDTAKHGKNLRAVHRRTDERAGAHSGG